MPGVPEECGTPSPVEALPCGSRSTTSTRMPCRASATARLTVVVVLPTPPFWLATVMTRRAGRRPAAGGGGRPGRVAGRGVRAAAALLVGDGDYPPRRRTGEVVPAVGVQ